MASVLALEGRDNVKGTNIKMSARQFVVTEIGLDFTQDEMEIPNNLASWTAALDSLVYSNKANSNNYVLKLIFENYPDNLLTLHSKYGSISKDFFQTFRRNPEKEEVLLTNQEQMWIEKLEDTRAMLKKLFCAKGYTPRCAPQTIDCRDILSQN